MKKLLAGIFAVALVLNLAACGGGASGSAGSGPAAGAAVNTETTAVQSDVKEAKDAKDASENVSTDDGAAAGKKAKRKKAKRKKDKGFLREATIEETVVADEDQFRITATSLEGTKLNFLLENKSDKTLEFTTMETNGLVQTVNGYGCGNEGSGFSEEVDPGASVETDMSFAWAPDLGIKAIADIQTGIRVSDDESYDVIAYVPCHLETSEAGYDYSGESFQKEVQELADDENTRRKPLYFTDDVDFDCCGIRILSAALIEEPNWTKLYLELENTTDENLYFYPKSQAFNDLFLSGSFSGVLVPAGKKAVSSENKIDRALDEETARLFGIEEISKVTIIGAVTTDIEDNTINQSGTLGAAPFTIKLKDGNDSAFSYQGAGEVLNNEGIVVEPVGIIGGQDKEPIQFLFAVTNNSGKDISIDIDCETEIDPALGMMIAKDTKVNGVGTMLFGGTDDLLPDGATGILSAVLDWSQFEACGVKGAADVKDMDAVLVIKDAENNILSKKNISVSY